MTATIAPPAEAGVGEYRVWGPPGCGKTSWTARQVHHAVQTHGPQAVIVSSLTRAAATEVAGRDLPIDKSQVGTLHSFAYRALGNPDVAEDPKRLSAWNDAHPRPDRQLSGGRKTDIERAGPEDLGARGGMPGDELMQELQRLRARLVPEGLWPVSVRAFHRDWEAWKREHGFLDFTDLLETALRDVREAPGRPEVGFFDEAQDLAPLALALARSWGSKMERFVLVGDDDQAIYYFLGATADAFLTPELPPDRERILSQSYRVPRKVQAAAMSWIEQVPRKTKEYRPRDFDGQVRELQRSSWKHPAELVRDLEVQVSAGRTCMVLATASFMLAPARALLRESGLAFWNPYRKASSEWNPLHPGRGIPIAERLLAFLRPDNNTWGELTRWWSADDYARWFDLVQSKGLLARGAKDAADEITKGAWGRRPDDALALGAEWIQPEQLAALMDAVSASGLDGDQEAMLRWLEPRLLAAKRESLKYPITIARKRGARSLIDDPKVVLGTVHSVKGGQADVVYVFPDLSPAAMREWSVPGLARDAIVRTFYVAITRAREQLVVCGPAGPFADLTLAVKATA